MYIKKFCLTNPTPYPPNRRKTKKERGVGGGTLKEDRILKKQDPSEISIHDRIHIDVP